MKNRKLSTIIAAVALITAPFAVAVPTIYLDNGNDGVGPFTVIADQTLADEAAAPGTVTVTTLTGAGTITGSTKPAIGTATNPALASVNLNISFTGTAALYFVEDGFGPTSQSFTARLQLDDLIGNSDATVQYYTYAIAGPFGGPFAGIGTPMTTLSLGAFGSVQAGGVLPFPGNPGPIGGYTLVQKIVFTQSTGTSQITATLVNNRVADGGTTVALLGASLLGLGAVRRKMIK